MKYVISCQGLFPLFSTSTVTLRWGSFPLRCGAYAERTRREAAGVALGHGGGVDHRMARSGWNWIWLGHSFLRSFSREVICLKIWKAHTKGFGSLQEVSDICGANVSNAFGPCAGLESAQVEVQPSLHRPRFEALLLRLLFVAHAVFLVGLHTQYLSYVAQSGRQNEAGPFSTSLQNFRD